MDSLFLTTKLRIPPTPQFAVTRQRVAGILENKIAHYKLVLISAAAGYGKTTLLAQWAAASRLPVAWLSVGKEDNNLADFFRYLLLGWEQTQPGVRESPLGLRLGAGSPDPDAVLAAFINVANTLSEPIAFVLDDYHLIEDPAIHTALTFLLDHLPPTIHLVLAGRAEPPLPLARYRAHQILLEFSTENLAFSLEESAEFLNGMMQLNLAQNEVVRLHAQLEGWAAGLQLVALTLQQHPDKADKLAVSGRHRFITDYLTEDVLAPLPDRLQQFMRQTSILNRLCGPLCNAVTGQQDGQALLETLERQNLFLLPLDNSREWFRFHRLFADFLRAVLQQRSPADIPVLHQRAARWYLAQNQPNPAFGHAVAGDDAALADQIIERYVAAKLLGGEVKVVEQWLNSVPASWNENSATLRLAQAGVLLITGQFDACARALDTAEHLAHTSPETERLQQARVTAMRCNIACFQNDLARAQALAEQALNGLPADDLSFRPGVYGALGDTYRRNGHWQEAKDCYLKLLNFTDSPVLRVQAAHVYGALADLELRQGHLRRAADYWREALAVIQKRENWGTFPLPLIGWVYIRLGELLYDWDELADAWEHVTQGLERAELGGDVRAMIAGYLLAARIKLTQGDSETAAAYLSRARAHMQNARFPDWTSRFERFQLELWLAQGRRRTAVEWVEAKLQTDALAGPDDEAVQLAVARVLIVKGDTLAVEQALSRLEHLRQLADTEGRADLIIQSRTLEALAHWQRGARANAMTSLEHALRLAEPEGYVRSFVDLGLPLARLLQAARSRAVMPVYVERLLAACNADSTSSAPAKSGLPEPLTPRELEILQLLAAGLTNREIAEQLVISPGTVKKHTANIYGKLKVRSRTEAAARGRELELLD
ncbi:MAG: HTH-type transcriptional regulator MalT [Anaerolineae bacterium]|nr:HTH-type transcriptional regulator MalT [Anaerolineae bacterium]